MQWVDLSKTSLLVSLASISFNPLAWNIVARNEYHYKTITRIFGGNAKIGCYFLASMIFSLGILRDSLFHRALSEQSSHPLLPRDTPFNLHIVLPVALFVIGQTLVITSTWALGITGTFLGDYFGILMDHRVEGFPFSVVENPMYTGSTLCFIATALWYEKPAGLLVALFVHICYVIALKFEGPFTTMIYSKRSQSAPRATKKEL
ncbi:hypothetical protein EW145_g4623 [Phellinidium pouzarii]|uniref:Phosphatidyl-N-methylethanolamine N-methyltransferase n=1 Tax=Phellinidium pouzarii TaxID=167371 RepID=A0A4S4L7Q8_9AGAM|nr:hypothetical protein EW145_g4623 [Phellinidium pouzarii]